MAIKLNRKGVGLSGAERDKENENLALIEQEFERVGVSGPIIEEALTKAKAAESKSDNVQKQLSTLVVNGDSSPQAIQASVGVNGEDYGGNLKARLDAEQQKVVAQLADMPQIHVSSGAPPDNSIGKDGDLFFVVLSPRTYYFIGNEAVKWVEGASAGTGVVAKEASNLLIEATGVAALRTYVTDTLINLSDVKTLFIEWENVGVEDGNGVSSVQTKLNISTDKAGNQAVHNLRFSPTTSAFGDGVFAKQITTCDVSSLAGSYYIRAHARSNGANAISRLKVFRVWGE